ncbi:MAG: PEP-CTERM sorting domain-containing protein [Verrucomicrobia bacterium]|nr:PEP-CTERM sorting domain-containing protein [Verrucomicrobiota bacterium]
MKLRLQISTQLSLLTLVCTVFISAGVASAAVTVAPGSSFTFDGVNGPLVESGAVPPNLGLSATPFAIDVGHNPPHSIPGLNDGVYGNANSWIGVTTRAIDLDNNGSTDVTSTFAALDLVGASPHLITSFAFGRSNRGDEFADRTSGDYFVQLTTLADPNVSTPDSDWATIGGINISSSDFGDTYRHSFTLNAPASATGIRIVTPGAGTAIDEIEVTAVPEPSAAVLALLGCLSFAFLRRRRRA